MPRGAGDENVRISIRGAAGCALFPDAIGPEESGSGWNGAEGSGGSAFSALSNDVVSVFDVRLGPSDRERDGVNDRMGLWRDPENASVVRARCGDSAVTYG